MNLISLDSRATPILPARADSFRKSTVDTHSAMKKVVAEFVSRIADCTIDLPTSRHVASSHILVGRHH